jgi:hypothetical protein
MADEVKTSTKFEADIADRVMLAKIAGVAGKQAADMKSGYSGKAKDNSESEIGKIFVTAAQSYDLKVLKSMDSDNNDFVGLEELQAGLRARPAPPAIQQILINTFAAGDLTTPNKDTPQSEVGLTLSEAAQKRLDFLREQFPSQMKVAENGIDSSLSALDVLNQVGQNAAKASPAK